MAESDIVIINNQMRFLSKYFLKMEEEELVHGAEIFAGYLEDEKFVSAVEEQGQSRQIFTLQFVESAVGSIFPTHKQHIMEQLVRLLLFDALVGNNDRHYFNWGVIRPMSKRNSLRFAPIYDTARGLFWNDEDEKIKKKTKNKNETEQYIKKYCKGSKPKIGWDGEPNINHFSMVENIVKNEFYITRSEFQNLFDYSTLQKMLEFIDSAFSKLFISERRTIIKECLKYRYDEIIKITNYG